MMMMFAGLINVIFVPEGFARQMVINAVIFYFVQTFLFSARGGMSCEAIVVVHYHHRIVSSSCVCLVLMMMILIST